MAKELFLTSYLAGTKDLVKEFLDGSTVENVAFIQTAADVEEYRGYVDEAWRVFRELGYGIDLLDVPAMQRSDIVEALDGCRCLYVSGGNTFYLLQELKRKDLMPYLAKRVLGGMRYIGESAGAIVASKDIEYNQIMDDRSAAPDLTDFGGLSLVDFYVLPHNGEFPFVESTAETIKVYGDTLDLLPIDNSEAVIVRGGDFVVKRQG